MTLDVLQEIKTALQEKKYPFFTDEELEQYYHMCGEDTKKTIYRCLIIKSEDTTLSVSGLNVADTSKYFRRLASHYRHSNSGTLKEWGL